MTCFQHSDPWVFMALLYGGASKGADIGSIVSGGDYVNHAVMSYEVLAGGLGRLVSAGIVEFREGRIWFVQGVLDEITTTFGRSRSTRKAWEEAERFLASHNSLSLALPEALGPTISREAFDCAVALYLAQNSM